MSYHLVENASSLGTKITLFISIIVLRGTDNISHNIPCNFHIQFECENTRKHFVECCQSHITLLWI